MHTAHCLQRRTWVTLRVVVAACRCRFPRFCRRHRCWLPSCLGTPALASSGERRSVELVQLPPLSGSLAVSQELAVCI